MPHEEMQNATTAMRHGPDLGWVGTRLFPGSGNIFEKIAVTRGFLPINSRDCPQSFDDFGHDLEAQARRLLVPYKMRVIGSETPSFVMHNERGLGTTVLRVAPRSARRSRAGLLRQ